MERIYDLKECTGKTVKNYLGENGNSQLGFLFTDETYIVLATDWASSLAIDEELHYSDEYDLGLISQKQYENKLSKDAEEREKQRYENDMATFEMIKTRYNL
jgi:hypothetical protein